MIRNLAGREEKKRGERGKQGGGRKGERQRGREEKGGEKGREGKERKGEREDCRFISLYSINTQLVV